MRAGPLLLPGVRHAADLVLTSDEATLRTQMELSEIPAPAFDEGARGLRMQALLAAAGLPEPGVDDVGNVVAVRPGSEGGPPLVVSAHLDTVFPPGTDVSVHREGDTLRGPGISDDARGLATLLSVARAMNGAGIVTRAPVLFVATVGEEGIGDLRGVKHLFAPGGAGHGAAGFLSLDGAGLDGVVIEGLGSRRYRVEVAGPGGHSWADWGTPNPIHALVALGRGLTKIELGLDPVSTLTIGRIGGGTSVNAIPQHAWVEIDTRSAAGHRLDMLEVDIRAQVEAARRAWDGLDVAITVIGDRPCGATSRDAPLVRAAFDATRAVGGHPKPALSSTDANVPMALGIPALTIGCGGEAGLAHTTDEWYRNTGGANGVLRALYTVVLTAGVTDAE